MAIEGHDCQDLVFVADRVDQVRHIRRTSASVCQSRSFDRNVPQSAPQVMHQLELVLDPDRAARHVNPLDGDVHLALARHWAPLGVVENVVLQIDRFVYGGERA